MADDAGKGAYGVRHVMQEEMEQAETGVFEPKSGEAGRKRKPRKVATDKPDDGERAILSTTSTRKAKG